MKNREQDELIPDWKIERYLLGELPDDEMARIRGRAERDGSVKARLEELERSDRQILRQHPAGVMARRIETRLATAGAPVVPPHRRRAPRLTWVPVAAAAAVIAVLWWNPTWSPVGPFFRPDSEGLGIRPKGPAAVLSLYRRTADGSERLENRVLAVEHDLIRARYQSDGETYGLIVSVDGRGVVTRHHPSRGGQAARLAAGSHALDFSYELDDAPRWEIFLLASSKSTFGVDSILDAIEASALKQSPGLSAAAADSVAHSLRLPAGVSISTFTLIKEAGNER